MKSNAPLVDVWTGSCTPSPTKGASANLTGPVVIDLFLLPLRPSVNSHFEKKAGERELNRP